MTDLEALAIQYREAERAWERAFLLQHTAPETERTARAQLVRTRLALDAEVERRVSGDPIAYLDALLEQAFRPRE